MNKPEADPTSLEPSKPDPSANYATDARAGGPSINPSINPLLSPSIEKAKTPAAQPAKPPPATTGKRKESYPPRLRAIALLMTLSLLSVILFMVTQNFQKDAVALRLQKTDQASFYIDRAKFGILRSFINILQLLGPNKAYYALEQNFATPGIFLPLSDSFDVAIGGLRVRSIDHYFFINRTNFNFENATVRGQIQIFKNVFKGLSSDAYNLNPLLNRFIGSLNDWISAGERVTTQNFLIGQKSYPNELVKTPKSALLDDLSELYGLPSFADLKVVNLEKTVYDLPIRIIRPSRLQACDIGPLNLNMLPLKAERRQAALNTFFDWAEGVTLEDCGYKELFAAKNRLVPMISAVFNQNPVAPFRLPLNRDAVWTSLTDQLGVKDVKAKINGFFSARSNLIEFRFSLQSANVQKSYIAFFSLSYKDDQAEIPDAIELVQLIELDPAE